MPGEPTLLRMLLRARHWQWPTFEAHFRRAAATLAAQDGEPALAKTAVSERQFERWCAGKVRTLPRPDACRVLEQMFGHPAAELLATVTTTLPAGDGLPGQGLRHLKSARHVETARRWAAVSDREPASVSALLVQLSNVGVEFGWPAWAGLKLAQLITLTDAWQSASGFGPLQQLVNEEIVMSEAVVPDGNPLAVLHDISRRHALMTIGALPAAMTGGSRESGSDGEVFLARCAASLTACWHLLKGSELQAVEQLLAGYLLPLEAAARRYSPQREAAAVLAAQAHRVYGIISLHRERLAMREHHCKRALQFAEIASDASSHASALISLASTYFYAADPASAAATYEQVFRHGTALPQLQRSRVYAELAVVYGQLGREQDSIRAAAQAEELYPDQPEQDPSYLYAEFTRGSLAL
jgi:hypothetical protein